MTPRATTKSRGASPFPVSALLEFNPVDRVNFRENVSGTE